MFLVHMAFSAVSSKRHPGLAFKFTKDLGLVMLAVGIIFSAIYFVLSVSLFARLANQQLDQKAKSAEVIVRAVANSRSTINSTTFIRNLQNGGFTDNIGVFDAKNHLLDHTDEVITAALGSYMTNPKVKLREVEEQKKLLQDVLAYRRARPSTPLFALNDVHYTALVQDNNTILIGLVVQRPKILILAVSFLLLCLLSVGINTLFVYHHGQSLAEALAQIVRGLDVDSLRTDSIKSEYEEIDALVHAADEKIRQSRIAHNAPALVPQVAAPTHSESGGDATLQLMQAKLFEKPFPRMQRHELTLYPRKPKLTTHEFISGAHDQGRIDVLIGITAVATAEALLAKHRLQERFWVLAKENLSSDEIARNLWSSLHAAKDLVPGIFFARLDEAENSMDIFRAGAVHLFEVAASGECHEIHLGHDEFGSEYTMVSEHRLTSGSHFVMVSGDAFNAMGLATGEFAMLLGKLGSVRSGKHLLASILEKIHQKLAAGEVVPGLLAVLSEKK